MKTSKQNNKNVCVTLTPQSLQFLKHFPRKPLWSRKNRIGFNTICLGSTKTINIISLRVSCKGILNHKESNSTD